MSSLPPDEKHIMERGKLPWVFFFQSAINPMIISSIRLGEWAESHLPPFKLPHLCQGYFVRNDMHYPLILFGTSYIFPQPRLLESLSLSSFNFFKKDLNTQLPHGVVMLFHPLISEPTDS